MGFRGHRDGGRARASFDKRKVNEAISSEARGSASAIRENFQRRRPRRGVQRGNDHRDSRVATLKIFEARRCTAAANRKHNPHKRATRGEELGRGIGGASDRMHFPCS